MVFYVFTCFSGAKLPPEDGVGKFMPQKAGIL